MKYSSAHLLWSALFSYANLCSLCSHKMSEQRYPWEELRNSAQKRVVGYKRDRKCKLREIINRAVFHMYVTCRRNDFAYSATIDCLSWSRVAFPAPSYNCTNTVLRDPQQKIQCCRYFTIRIYIIFNFNLSSFYLYYYSGSQRGYFDVPCSPADRELPTTGLHYFKRTCSYYSKLPRNYQGTS
jgi:hypothetical protein